MKLPMWGLVPVWAVAAAELGGFIVGATRWSRLGRGQKMTTLWFGASATADLVDLGLRGVLRNTQPIQSVLLPFSAILAFEALASYQITSAKALRFRLVGIGYALAWALLHLTVERIDLYSAYSTPLYGLVILGGAGIVIYQRVLRGRGDFMLDPAFLVAAGLCGVAVATVFKTLVGALWFQDNPVYLLIFYSVCNVLTALAELVIIKSFFLSSERPAGAPS